MLSLVCAEYMCFQDSQAGQPHELMGPSCVNNLTTQTIHPQYSEGTHVLVTRDCLVSELESFLLTCKGQRARVLELHFDRNTHAQEKCTMANHTHGRGTMNQQLELRTEKAAIYLKSHDTEMT